MPKRNPSLLKRGVPGAPPSAVRAAARLAFADRIKVLCEIADGTLTSRTQLVTKTGQVVTLEHEPTLDERIKAIDKLGKYGGLLLANVKTEDPGTSDDRIRAAALSGALTALGSLASRLAGSNETSSPLALAGEVQSTHSVG